MKQLKKYSFIPLDIWRVVIEFFEYPNDFLSVILLNKNTSLLLNDETPKYTKYIIFDRQYRLLDKTFRDYILPKRTYKYVWLLLSFERYKNMEEFSENLLNYSFPNLKMEEKIQKCKFDKKYFCGISCLRFMSHGGTICEDVCCRCFRRITFKCPICCRLLKRKKRRDKPIFEKKMCLSCSKIISSFNEEDMTNLKKIVKKYRN
jgi:hypothetical protein